MAVPCPDAAPVGINRRYWKVCRYLNKECIFWDIKHLNKEMFGLPHHTPIRKEGNDSTFHPSEAWTIKTSFFILKKLKEAAWPVCDVFFPDTTDRSSAMLSECCGWSLLVGGEVKPRDGQFLLFQFLFWYQGFNWSIVNTVPVLLICRPDWRHQPLL